MKTASQSLIRIVLVLSVLFSLTLSTIAAEPGLESFQADAQKGDAKAQYELARRYDQGKGVGKDFLKAAEYLRKSADQGFAEAEIMLGSYYGRGLGVEKSPEEAVKWYRKAADQGNALAQFALGGFYFNGSGVEKDATEAIAWWKKAAEQNNVAAQGRLGQIYFLPFDEKTNHENYQEAAKWLRKAAEQGDVPSMHNLGLLYEQGFVNRKSDPIEALKWYTMAAERGNPKSQSSLALMYMDGRGVQLSLPQAYAWMKLSYDQGDPVARKYLDGYALADRMSSNEVAQADMLLKEHKKVVLSNTRSKPAISGGQ